MQSQGQLAAHVVISKAIYVQDVCCGRQDLGLKNCVSLHLTAQTCFCVAVREERMVLDDGFSRPRSVRPQPTRYSNGVLKLNHL